MTVTELEKDRAEGDAAQEPRLRRELAAAQERGLLPLNQMSLEFYNRVAYHDYEGIALSNAEKQRLVVDLGDKAVMILRNHGLLTVGATPNLAWAAMLRLVERLYPDYKD